MIILIPKLNYIKENSTIYSLSDENYISLPVIKVKDSIEELPIKEYVNDSEEYDFKRSSNRKIVIYK